MTKKELIKNIDYFCKTHQGYNYFGTYGGVIFAYNTTGLHEEEKFKSYNDLYNFIKTTNFKQGKLLSKLFLEYKKNMEKGE